MRALIVSGSEAINAARAGAPRAASMNTSITASKEAVSAFDSGGQSSMNPTASYPECSTVENTRPRAGGSNHRYVWISNGLAIVTRSVNSSLSAAALSSGMGANSRSSERDTSAVIAMSPPEAPMTSTLRPPRAPPVWNTLSVSQSVARVSQRAIPACRQKASNTESAPASAPVWLCAVRAAAAVRPDFTTAIGLPARRALSDGPREVSRRP